MNPIKICFFGDSICQGQFISPHQTWVTRISLELSRIASILVSNCSINGNTTRMALERFPFDVQSHEVDILYVQFGLNDCNFWKTDNGLPRVSLKAFEANLTEIVERGRQFGAQKILLATNHPTPQKQIMDYAPMSFQENNEIYNQTIRSVARKSSIQLVEVENAFLEFIQFNNMPLKTFLHDDGIHLGEKGHDLYFNTVYPIITSSVKAIKNECVHKQAFELSH